jgi:adenylate cyclase
MMSLADDIKTNVADYLAGDYEVTEGRVLPSVEDVPFGKVAKKMNLCVLYIDLRHSTDLLFLHNKQTAGKIHKAFLYTVSAVIRNFGGQIRSFNGDSVLAFWPASYKTEITSCVRAAMTAKWLLGVELSPLFEGYEKLDFGIGVDWGEVFIGRCVNFAVAIGEQARGPNHVEISQITYSNLEDAAVRGTQDGQEVDMWRDGIVNWQGKDNGTKLTSWYWKL